MKKTAKKINIERKNKNREEMIRLKNINCQSFALHNNEGASLLDVFCICSTCLLTKTVMLWKKANDTILCFVGKEVPLPSTYMLYIAPMLAVDGDGRPPPLLSSFRSFGS